MYLHQMNFCSYKFIVVVFCLSVSNSSSAGDSLYIKSLKSYAKIVEPIEGLLLVQKNQLYGLSDSSGKLFVPMTHKTYLTNSRFLRFDKKWGIINGKKIILDFICDSIDVGDGLAIISQNGKFGITSYMDPFFASQIIYDSIQVGFNETWIDAAFINSKIDLYRLTDSEPQKLNKDPFDSVAVAQLVKGITTTSPQEYLFVKRNNKWGVMSDSGKMVVEMKYDNINDAKNKFSKMPEVYLLPRKP